MKPNPSTTRASLFASAALLICVNAPAWAWSVKVTEHPSGGYVASLIHGSEPAQNKTVGHYATKSEARKAGKAAKKEAEGFKAEDSGPCADPMSGVRC